MLYIDSGQIMPSYFTKVKILADGQMQGSVNEQPADGSEGVERMVRLCTQTLYTGLGREEQDASDD